MSKNGGGEDDSKAKGRTKIYPIAAWFKKKRFTLKKGVDFSCKTYAMVSKLRHYAGLPEYRLSLRIRVAEDEMSIHVTVRGKLDVIKQGVGV